MGFFQRIGNGIARFMYGRNGMDQLNRALLAGYLLLINLWAFGLMGFDKSRARRRGARRIRERTLFLSALLGGGLGAVLGMWVFRHKTRHWYFVWGLPLILLAQIALAVWLARWLTV